MWLAYQVSLDYPLQEHRKPEKSSEKGERNEKTFSSCSLQQLQVKELCCCIWRYFLNMSLQHNIPREDAEEEKEEEEMAASQVNVLSWVWGCVCFSSWNAWTENPQTLVLWFWLFYLGCLLSTPYFLSFNSEASLLRLFLPYVPEPFLHCLYPSFLESVMHSLRDFQLVNIFPWWEIYSERHWYQRFPLGCSSVLGS